VDRQKLDDAGDGDEFMRNFENACDVLNKLAEKEQTLALRSNLNRNLLHPSRYRARVMEIENSA
jgi:hypothetical protein